MITKLRDFCRSDEGRRLLGVLLLALVLRIAAGIGTTVIDHDGTRYTMSARAIRAGNWDVALNVEPRMPPLYPLAIAAVGSLTGDLGGAGILISILFGTLLVIPVYLLARSIWNPGVAILAALVVAIIPDLAIDAGDVWTEPLYFFLFFSAIAATWFACERPALWKYALAGFLGGLAVNTRPEGIYTLGAMVGWSVVAGLIHRNEKGLRIGGPALAVVIWIALIFPYSNWIHKTFGFWSPTANQFAVKLLGKPNMETSYTEGYNVDVEVFELGKSEKKYGVFLGKVLEAAKIYSRAGGYIFVPLILFGFFFVKQFAGLRRGFVYLLLVALGYAIPSWVGMAVGLPFGIRFALPTIIALAPLAAMSMIAMYRRFSGRITVARVALALLIIGCAIRPFAPHARNRGTLADAGRWIRAKYGSDKWILQMERRIEHYADAWSERIRPTFAEMQQQVAARNPVVIAVYAPYVDRQEPDFEKKLAAAYPLVHTIPKSKRGDEVRIYEVSR